MPWPHRRTRTGKSKEGVKGRFPKNRDQAFAELSFGMQNFSVDLDRLGIDKDESDRTGPGAAIDPIVNRAALHDHIARL